MIRFAWLRPPEAARLDVRGSGVLPPVELPLAVPMAFAEGCGSGPAPVLLWTDPESNMVGLFQDRSRVAWKRDVVEGVRFIALKPAEGPGAAGLELVIFGEEVPVLAGSPYSDALLVWFREKKSLWREFFGHAPRFVDYGWDR